MHMQSICDSLEVPFIDSRWDYWLKRDHLSINLYPHPSVLSSAFIHLINIWGWRDFFLVYEEDEAIVRMKEFLIEGEKTLKEDSDVETEKSENKDPKWKIKMYQFNRTSSFRDTFWQIKRAVKTNKDLLLNYHIVLDVSRKNLYTALKAAQQVGMMTEDQKYLIVSLDLHTIDMEDFQHTKANITSLRLVQDEMPDFQNIMLEVNHRLSQRSHEPLKTLKTEAALVYDSVLLFSHALEQMNQAKNITSIPPVSCNSMNKGIDGTSLINFMKSIGSILPGNRINRLTSINITAPGSSEFQYLELEYSHFRVTTFLSDPYAMLRESPTQMKGNDRFEGYGIDLLNALADLLHFTYEIHEVKDGKHGAYNETTDYWDGMIGEIVREEADLAVADLTITEARLKGVDFTLPFMQTGISILFKKPTEKVTSLLSFLSPFSGEVWLLVLAAYTFISLSYFFVGRLSPYEWFNPHPCRTENLVEENVFSLLNSMWFAIGSFMRQGSDLAPIAPSTRAVSSTWAFFCLIMISSYTANLAAFLTVEKLVSPIENVEDLANQEKIKYGCLHGGSTSGFFKKSNITTYQKMHKFMEKHAKEVFVTSNTEGIEKVKKGNYAYLMEATSIEYNTERECNLTQIGGLLDSKGYGIAVKKGKRKLRNWLTGGILRLQQDGILHNIKERWWKQKKGGGICSQTTKASGTVNELGLGNVGGVFVVMLLGLFLSACVGVAEFFWFQRKLRRDTEISLLKLLMGELKYAVTCGSSSKSAPKLKTQSKDEVTRAFPGYSSLQ
ncbi:glutamate receptor ionotropic, kainate 2-like isoform X2 [Stegodyphus dumicola]|uniref:glutamate receptor ionotropic, kainate 2-like isoform X2 n=1 Tax=Stegodyphus dumicola TaxID=202533 RepID=UPI0015AC2087|nr:glutamate receptor ionotropic, kainate 2-like isoform X2 [Stegodyphus dumicola]